MTSICVIADSHDRPGLVPPGIGLRTTVLSPIPALSSLSDSYERIEAAYFPESGFASVVAIQSSNSEVESRLPADYRRPD